jgi:hypothetical protein
MQMLYRRSEFVADGIGRRGRSRKAGDIISTTLSRNSERKSCQSAEVALNPGAARPARYDNRSRAWIDMERQIELPLRLHAAFDEQLSDDPALAPGLRRDQGAAEQLRRGRSGLGRRCDAAHSAGCRAVPGQDLRLDKERTRPEPDRCSFRFLCGFRSCTFGNGNTILGQDLLRLKFVHLHGVYSGLFRFLS